MMLSRFLKGHTVTRRSDDIQPNMAKTSDIVEHLGVTIGEAHLQTTTNALMGTSLVGFTEPNPVHYTITPRLDIYTGSKETKQSNTKGGKC